MTVLGREALNRAFLERQMLLSRRDVPALDAVEHLVGLQAQAPNPPYYGLWSRLADFRPEELSRLLTGRQVVRIVVMRGTVHLVSARDCRSLRPWTQPLLERGLRSTFGRRIGGLDLDQVTAAARELLAERPRTTAELGELLTERWPEQSAQTLVNVVRCLLPVVQTPPRGVWGRTGQTAYATARDWLGVPLEERPDPGRLVMRYLAAFGPATVRDVQAWSGLSRLGEVTRGLKDRLAVFRDESGRELLDLPDAPRPDPGTPAPVRFLAPYDNAILSHADRTRIISDEHRLAIRTKNAVIPGTVLVGGFVRGAWRIDRERAAPVLTVQLFAPVRAGERAELAQEGERLLGFGAAPDAAGVIRFADFL